MSFSIPFFEDNKKVGFALIIVGLINLIMGVVGIILAIFSDDGNVGAAAVAAIGFVISGVFLFFYGQEVRNGPNNKVKIVSGLIRIIALITIVSAIFIAISNYMASDDFGIGAALIFVIVQIIVGLILLWISSKVSGANKNVISNLLWIILVVVFLILTLLAILGFVNGLIGGDFVGAIREICMVVVYLYAFLACLSPEVKSSMGV